MGFDWNPIHDVEQLGHDAKSAWDEVTSGANTAPVPQVTSSPPPPVQPRTWTAPAVNASGHITVHHGALTTASDVIKNYVTEIDNAVSEVTSHIMAFDSLMGWDTGASFGGNLQNAVTAFTQAGQDTSQAHADTAGNLQSTAATYGDTETANARLASNIGGGSSPAAPSGSPAPSAPASGGPSSSGPSSSGSAPSGSSSASSGNWG